MGAAKSTLSRKTVHSPAVGRDSWIRKSPQKVQYLFFSKKSIVVNCKYSWKIARFFDLAIHYIASSIWWLVKERRCFFFKILVRKYSFSIVFPLETGKLNSVYCKHWFMRSMYGNSVESFLPPKCGIFFCIIFQAGRRLSTPRRISC